MTFAWRRVIRWVLAYGLTGALGYWTYRALHSGGQGGAPASDAGTAPRLELDPGKIVLVPDATLRLDLPQAPRLADGEDGGGGD